MTVKVSSIIQIMSLKVHISVRLLVTCLGTLCWFQIGLIFKLTSWTFDVGYKPNLIKRVWDSWVPIPVGVGLSLLAYLQWRRLERERNKGLNVASNWEITCYKALPLKSFSRAFGAISETTIPIKLRPYVYGGYARAFKVDLSEMSEPVDHYSCLCEFFTRKLKDGARPIDAHLPLVSPADGTVLNAGKVNSFQVEQVKGVTYSLRSFLGDFSSNQAVEITKDINSNEVGSIRKPLINDDWISYKRSLLHDPENNDLYQCVVYLAPGDYHRFHSPADWHVSYRKHFTGELLSVNPSIARWIPGLFTLNERALYVGTWQYGYFSMTAVGATNVGSIRVFEDKDLHTNTKRSKNQEKNVILDLNWTKGAEIGEFRMGSTIVLIFEAPKNFALTLQPSQRVRVGQGITSHF